MSYASKGEKIFSLPQPNFQNCTPPEVKRSDHRLKKFISIRDRRAWNCSETLQYRYLYYLVTGSQVSTYLFFFLSLIVKRKILLSYKLLLIKNLVF